MISVDEAKSKLLEKASICCEIERIPLHLGLSRVLATPVMSRVSVPPEDNSAMDGYAVISSEIIEHKDYQISQRIPAGKAPELLKPGTVARIFTGAEIPKNADAVIIQENAISPDMDFADDIDRPHSEENKIRFIKSANAEDNIRKKGQDVTEGDEILASGTRLRPQEIGLLASCGVSEISVYKKLKVAVLSTGDELVEVGKALKPGQIYNSNRYLLATLIEKTGFEYIDFPPVADDFEQTKAAISKAADLADVVITCGGVSVGEEDYVKAAVEAIGSLNLWKVAIKPGKPLAFGQINSTENRKTDFIGLPGNPSSVFATFLVLALPRLQKLQGLISRPQIIEQLPAEFDRSEVHRREYLRAKRSFSTTGTSIEIYPNQSSGVLSSASWGDGFAIQMEHSSVSRGQKLDFIPYDSFYV